jgi:amino acid transporter
MTGACTLLMYFSMVINESLVARTFGTYTLQLFGAGGNEWLIPTLGVGLLAFAFVVNVLGNELIQTFSFFMAFLKIAGIAIFAAAGLWVSGWTFQSVSLSPQETTAGGFLGAVALAILAYKGFTTITNSGGEIRKPERNVGRAIVISIAICVLIYVLVALAVGGSLTIEEIATARDYVLAEAARPAFGAYGLWFTVVFAIIATVSGLIASVFAVSRMLAMVTEMKLVPHSHFGMSGTIQKHTLVYTVVIAMILTVFFDLSRIASLGAILYILMDIVVQWGVIRYLRQKISASPVILAFAIGFDVLVLAALLIIKVQSDLLVIYAAVVSLVLIFVGERLFLHGRSQE